MLRRPDVCSVSDEVPDDPLAVLGAVVGGVSLMPVACHQTIDTYGHLFPKVHERIRVALEETWDEGLAAAA